MRGTSVDQKSGRFEPDKFEDQYETALVHDLINQKRAGKADHAAEGAAPRRERGRPDGGAAAERRRWCRRDPSPEAGQEVEEVRVWPTGDADAHRRQEASEGNLGEEALRKTTEVGVVAIKHPVTMDGRYSVVRGRLWRMADPSLDEAQRDDHVRRLMAARRAVRDAKQSADHDAEAAAHRAVDEVKRALGECGPVWWKDGSPDLNRHMAKNTPYADWHATIGRSRRGGS